MVLEDVRLDKRIRGAGFNAHVNMGNMALGLSEAGCWNRGPYLELGSWKEKIAPLVKKSSKNLLTGSGRVTRKFVTFLNFGWENRRKIKAFGHPKSCEVGICIINLMPECPS